MPDRERLGAGRAAAKEQAHGLLRRRIWSGSGTAHPRLDPTRAARTTRKLATCLVCGLSSASFWCYISHQIRAREALVEQLRTSGDVLFILLGAILVLAMHAGFAFLELGTVRKKNQVNALV